jgi:hypothetical protein
MFQRYALATLLIGFLAVSANAQKDKSKTTGLLRWETVTADKTTKMTTRRASVPGGWLVLVQIDEEVSLAFLPDVGHQWSDDRSPSDVKPGKFALEEATKAGVDKFRDELEKARAQALAERDRAEGALRKAEEERRRALEQLETARRERKPKKGEKGAAATTDLEAVKKEVEALRDQAERLRATAEEARRQEAAVRREAEAQRARAEEVASRFAEEAAKAKAEVKKLQAELDQARKDVERLKQLLDKTTN